MATNHEGAGHPIARDDLHVEDPEATGMDNNNSSISGLDTTVALGGLEAEANPDELLPSNQAKLTAPTWEINELHQQVEAREGHPVESLDHIGWGTTKSLSSTSTTTFPQLLLNLSEK